jgi:hypothetical protein
MGGMRWLIPLLLAAVTIASESSAWAMRWRTWCDPESGIAFRHPYMWLPQQMHEWALDRELGGGRSSSTVTVERVVVIDGKKVMVPVTTAAVDPNALPNDLLIFSEMAANTTLEAVAEAKAKAVGKLTWEAWDYYRADPARPHADPKQAPAGITAKLGTAKDRCVLAIQHGDRISGLVFAGAIDREHTRQVMDSFEIMLPDKAKKGAVSTWRERQFRAGKVLTADGKAIAATKSKPVPWSQGWEIETEHYHITAHTSPARLLEHGAYYEALYRTYAELYEPDKMPPLKFEVHIFDLYTDFQSAAASFGIPIGMGGGITGGFFAPRMLSLWVYEESGKLGGPDFTVEHVSAHECSHQFLFLACNGKRNVPTWFNEGVAVYFENGIFRGGKFVTQPPKERIELLKSQYASGKRMLMAPEWYLDHHGGIDASQYGEVYAMVHFWVFGQGKEGKNRFKAYWQAMRAGEDGTEAFQRIFLDDMIKAKGSRAAAMAAWHEAMVNYVRTNKNW